MIRQPMNGPIPQIDTRDYLWIECKAASENTPIGWKNVMGEAAHRLSTAHPNRAISLIIATGWYCAYFEWNPFNQRVQQQLHIRHAKGNGRWAISPYIEAAGITPWINLTTNEFNPAYAAKLDCFNLNAQMVLVDQVNLQLIEDFLIRVRNTPLPGLNPPEFCKPPPSLASHDS